MKTRLLQRYRKNPERFKKLIRLAKRIDIDRSELIQCLKESPATKAQRGWGCGMVLGLTGSYLLSELVGCKDQTVVASLVAMGGSAGAYLGVSIPSRRYGRKYDSILKEALKNNHSPYSRYALGNVYDLLFDRGRPAQRGQGIRFSESNTLPVDPEKYLPL